MTPFSHPASVPLRLHSAMKNGSSVAVACMPKRFNPRNEHISNTRRLEGMRPASNPIGERGPTNIGASDLNRNASLGQAGCAAWQLPCGGRKPP